MIGFMEHFLDEMDTYQMELKEDSYLQAADWKVVSDMTGRTSFLDLIQAAKNTLANLENEKKDNTLTKIRDIFKQTAIKKNILSKESSNDVYIEYFSIIFSPF